MRMRIRCWPSIRRASTRVTRPSRPKLRPGRHSRQMPGHRYVATESSRVLGWVAASAVSARCVYAGVVEHSVYVDPAARGLGVGRTLLQALIGSAETAGVWTIQSSIFPENTA